MSNLLEKASIVTTPTAYDNGKILSVKPNTSVGDFDFTRNSSATRVNSQGLIEDVQILSSNLVSNGDFSQEGSELITNGDFATDSYCAKQTSWSISGGAANYDFLSDAKYIRQTLLSGGFVAGKAYKINFEITSGTAYMNVSSNGGGLISLNTYSVGSYSIYVIASASGSDLLIYGRNTSGTAFSIDNVSVKEVGQDWTFGTGWSIGEDKATVDNTVNANLDQLISGLSGKKVKVSFEISDLSSGGILVGDIVNPGAYNATSNGIHTFDYTATNSTLRVRAYGNPCSITNISVIEITDDTNLPRIDYTDGVGSWLFEPQSTNTITSSNSGFLAFNMDLAYNNATSPDGTQNAFKATTTTASGSQFRPNQTITTPSTFSIFLKYGNNQWYQVINSSATGFYANIDVQNGVFGTSGAQTDNLSVKDYGNGWYRFSGTFTSASTNGSIRVYASSFPSAGWAGVSAPIGSYVYGYGFQVEASSFATSYIPTNGSTVTRLQDAAFGAGSSDLINSTEGVLYAEIATLVNGGVNRYISLSDNTTSNRLNVIFSSNTDRLTISGVGDIGGFTNINFLSYTQNVYNKIAIKYSSSGVKLFVNGSLEGSNSDNVSWASNTLTTLDFTLWNQSTAPFEGKIKCVAVFKEALTDEELTCLTTI